MPNKDPGGQFHNAIDHIIFNRNHCLTNVSVSPSNGVTIDSTHLRGTSALMELKDMPQPTEFVPKAQVEATRRLAGGNVTRFALELEKEVYGDDLSKLKMHVEKRLRTPAKIAFIKEACPPFYMVSGDPKVQPGDKVLKGKTNVVAAMLSRGRQAGTALILQQELTKPCKLNFHKLYNRLKRQIYWPGKIQHIRQWTRECQQCFAHNPQSMITPPLSLQTRAQKELTEDAIRSRTQNKGPIGFMTGEGASLLEKDTKRGDVLTKIVPMFDRLMALLEKWSTFRTWVMVWPLDAKMDEDKMKRLLKMARKHLQNGGKVVTIWPKINEENPAKWGE
ncbi:unnamed protein product [Heligmosomoides polygyrus]|uniref:Integrase_H2C2 domain-containing protein n=1 Tax=Heligmosomoides polygyrus TaxID=6339 RepID=A0A3P8BN62_HELPZ|nr:unnamed protein product [Heligmosomoides polygyrus]